MSTRHRKTEWYVISGAPGSGKTSLVELLGKKGYATLPEAARRYIDLHMGHGDTLESLKTDQVAFQLELLALQVRMERNQDPDLITFLDRGIPDMLAYWRHHKLPENAELLDAVQHCAYKKVFMLQPFSPVIVDYARKESEEEQRAIHEELVRTYTSLSFPIVSVPALPLEERAAFVLARL